MLGTFRGPIHKEWCYGSTMGHERPGSDAGPHMTLPSSLSPISGTWPDQNLQNTWPSLHWACFDVQGPWVQANLYGLSCHAPILVMPRQLLQLTEADAESEGKGDGKLGRLSGMGFRGWVFLYRPWTLPCVWKGMGQVSPVDTHVSLSCPRASSTAPSSVSSLDYSRPGTRAGAFLPCTGS